MGDCSFSTTCGCRDYYFNTGISHIHFNVGACDQFWGNLSDIRYAIYGGRCDIGAVSGMSCLYLSQASGAANRDDGACIVIKSMVVRSILF